MKKLLFIISVLCVTGIDAVVQLNVNIMRKQGENHQAATKSVTLVEGVSQAIDFENGLVANVMVEIDAQGKVVIETHVFDTSTADPKLISKPLIRADFGESAEITLSSDDGAETLYLSVIATQQ